MSVDSELLCVCMTHVVKAAILCVFIYLIYVIALQHLYLLCIDCCRHLCGHTIVAFKHMCVHIEVGKKNGLGLLQWMHARVYPEPERTNKLMSIVLKHGLCVLH